MFDQEMSGPRGGGGAPTTEEPVPSPAGRASAALPGGSPRRSSMPDEGGVVGGAAGAGVVEGLAGELGSVLVGLDVEGLSGVEAQGLVAVLARLERQVAAGVARCGVRAAASTLRQQGGQRAAGEWLGRLWGRSRREAELALVLAEHIGETPEVFEAWMAGELSVEQADQVVQGTRIAPEREGELVDLARRVPVEDLRRELRRMRREDRDESVGDRAERHHRDRSLSMWTNHDDAFEGRFVTGAVQGASIGSVIELCGEAVFRRARRLGERHSLAAYRIDGLALMSQLATGAHPADLGFHLADLPAGLRPHPDDIDPADWDDLDTTDPEHDGNGDDEPARYDPADIAEPDPVGNDDTDSVISAHGRDGEPRSDSGTPRPSDSKRTGRRYRPKGVGPPAFVVVVDMPEPSGSEPPGEPRVEIPGYGQVPVSWAIEHLGDGLLRIVVRDGVDVRTVCHSRRPTAHQVTALFATGAECSVAGCATRTGLQIDHDQPWSQIHETWLPNLKRVCSYHHDRKTNHRWDWVVEAPDPATGKHRLVPRDHPDHPANTRTPKRRPGGHLVPA